MKKKIITEKKSDMYNNIFKSIKSDVIYLKNN